MFCRQSSLSLKYARSHIFSDYDRGGKELYEALGCPVSREEFIVRFEEQWPWMQGVLCQHLLGGLLCVPAILEAGDPATRTSLACLSVLSEMGWEIEDMLTWIYKRWFVKGGKVKVPLGLIVLLGLHHSLSKYPKTKESRPTDKIPLLSQLNPLQYIFLLIVYIRSLTFPFKQPLHWAFR
jgi:hypothetical protein